MKILLISNGFPPRDWAGTETYTAGIAQELKKRQYQIQVLCGGDWDNGPNNFNGYLDTVYRNIPIRYLNLNWKKAADPFRYLYDNPVIAGYVSKYLRDLQPDLVHVTSCERLSASVLKVVRMAGIPMILSLTDFWFLCPQINLLRSDGNNCSGQTTPWDCLECKLFHTRVYHWSQCLLPPGHARKFLMKISRIPRLTRLRGLRGMAGDMADRKGYLTEAISWPDCRRTASQFVSNIFLNNGVDVPIKVQPYGHELDWLNLYDGKLPSGVVRFGFIGQIINSKGVHLLLQAANLLPETLRKKFSISVFGDLDHDPAYSSGLLALAKNNTQIHFLGTYVRNKSASVYAGIDVLVVPSLWYDFPLVIHEAFATNTPVIASNIGSMAEVITHDVNGLLFERNNPADMARQLERIIEEPGLLGRLRAGILPVKRINEEIDELEDIYHTLA